MAICDERERMFFDALGADEEGPRHHRLRHHRPRAAHVLPLPRPDPPGERAARTRREWADAIARVYERMDALLGRVWREVERTRHRVHGDQRPRLHQLPPRREPQHLAARQRLPGAEGRPRRRAATGSSTSTGPKTRAFRSGSPASSSTARGARASGIVAEGDEYAALVAGDRREARGAGRPRDGPRARSARCAPPTRSSTGPYRLDAPDLLIGYEGGYRNSLGVRDRRGHRRASSRDNTKSWSRRPLRRSRHRAGRASSATGAIATERPRLARHPGQRSSSSSARSAPATCRAT